MVKLKITSAGLELIPDDHEALQDENTLIDALETNLANGWSTIDPPDIGGLTEATIISDDVSFDDDGMITHLGDVYFDHDYQIRDTLEQLKAGKTVVWRKG